MDQKLLTSLIQAAKDVFPTSMVMQQVCVTQAIHESALLGNGSKLALVYNNYFGIKGSGTNGSVFLNTTEYIKGTKVTVKAKFAYNKTIVDSFEQYSRVLALPRYSAVMASKEPGEAFKMLVKGGYATDPAYANRLNSIWLKYVKPAFNN